MTMPDDRSAPRPFKTEMVNGMMIEWDVPIEMDDGAILRADVFRPADEGSYPVILSYGPYGKGKSFENGYPLFWKRMLHDHPDILGKSSGRYMVYELVDPEHWVPDGYICVRVDGRGTGRSPGLLDLSSAREARDTYQCIEWAARQPWSNARVGMNGISYYAMNEWQVASLRPPSLAAICVWEGLSDLYREPAYHGGIYTPFVDFWFRAVLATQYGVGDRGPRNANSGQFVCGDVNLSEAELAANRVDYGALMRAHPFFDDFFRGRDLDFSKIDLPLLSAGNWGGHGLHLRGNTRGFERAASEQKWLDMHDDTHFSLFYTEWGRNLQKRFLGHFLKDEDTGWANQPKVRLSTRRVDGGTDERVAAQWPLPTTRWTRHFLGDDGHMGREEAVTTGRIAFQAGSESVGFSLTCPETLEICGPVAAKLFIESSTTDADLFLVLRAFDPDGTEIVFNGANDPHTPVAQGWLRASHRALDEEQSRPFLPVHSHLEACPLTPDTIYEVDVEILPTSLILPTGYTLRLDVQSHDYAYPPAIEQAAESPLGMMMTGSGLFLHDGTMRPPEIYQGKITVHTGGANASYLLLPVIPMAAEADDQVAKLASGSLA